MSFHFERSRPWIAARWRWLRVAISSSAWTAFQMHLEGAEDPLQSFRFQLTTKITEIRDFASSQFDPEPAVYQRATRALLRLVEEDHDATVEEVLSGPLEQLADAAIAIELVGQGIPEEPKAAAEQLQHFRRATKDA